MAAFIAVPAFGASAFASRTRRPAAPSARGTPLAVRLALYGLIRRRRRLPAGDAALPPGSFTLALRPWDSFLISPYGLDSLLIHFEKNVMSDCDTISVSVKSQIVPNIFCLCCFYPFHSLSLRKPCVSPSAPRPRGGVEIDLDLSTSTISHSAPAIRASLCPVFLPLGRRGARPFVRLIADFLHLIRALKLRSSDAFGRLRVRRTPSDVPAPPHLRPALKGFDEIRQPQR